jgi:hypothetical protein
MKGFFAILLRLYPPDYRKRFSGEMRAVFQETARDRRAEGLVSYVLFLLTELAGLFYGIAEERIQNSRGRRTGPPVALLLTGGAVSVILVRVSLLLPRFAPVAQRLLDSNDQRLQLVALATGSILLVATLSLAFVLNLMIMARRRA